jgi:hypothetical protein
VTRRAVFEAPVIIRDQLHPAMHKIAELLHDSIP